MKTTILSVLVLAGFAGPAFAQRGGQPDVRPQGREGRAEQFRRLPEERQQQLRERMQRFQQLSAEEKAQLRERMQRLQTRVADKAPERVERLRQLRGQLHRPEGRPERGRADQNPQALQEGRQQAQRLANQKRDQLVDRLLNAGKIDRAQAERMRQMPLPEFFAMVRRIAGQNPQARPGNPERPQRGEPGRKPQRGEQPPQRPAGGERRGGA